MALVKDFDKYKLGIEMVDNHHRNLINIVNELFDALTKGVKPEIIEHFIKRLRVFSLSHFRSEEEFMLKHKYPDLLAHKIIHKNFIDKIDEFTKKIGKEFIGKELITFLVTWLIDHILKEDKKYADFILKKEY